MSAYSAKRSFSQLQNTKLRCPREISEDDGPVKKKLKKNLIEIFNRASICQNVGDDHMSVFLRIKPFTSDDSTDEDQGCLKVNESEQSVVAAAPEQSHAYRGATKGLGKSEHKFTISRIFNENTSQADFFNETMLGMTKEFISGQNSLVFTYGVTSSGKTYTIQGQPQDAGILPRSLDVIFNSIQGKQISGITFKPLRFTDVVKLSHEEEYAEYKVKEKILKMCSGEDTTYSALLGDETDAALSTTVASSCSVTSQDDVFPDIESRVREELKVDVDDQNFNFSVWVSFAEIYNEQMYDLLEKTPHKKSSKRPALKIADDQNGSPYIKGLKEVQVETADEAYRLLKIGQRNLQTAVTRLNHCSSRSHCLFTIKLIRVVDKDDPNIARVSMLSFCDLAGSERYSKTQATGDRIKEAGNINTSLMTLGRCIEILRYNQMHRDSQKIVPFRDSKLTRLFQNFFNGSGRAAMIVNVSQCASMFDETLHVFKFSAIAKQVKYQQKPVEPVRPKRNKVAAPLPKASIAWEESAPSKELLEDASNQPLPTDDSEEEEEFDMDRVLSKKTSEELKEVVKELMDKNQKLMKCLEEEIINSSNTEVRVRREVCDQMKKQQVLIEKEYSKLLEDTEEEAREEMDERIQSVVDMYEKKIERIQRKVDEDDEWYSSVEFFQEQRKVQEKEAKIAALELELTELKRENEEKDQSIEELKSYLKEAGDVYKDNMAQIEKLQQEAVNFALEAKSKDEEVIDVTKEKKRYEEKYAECLQQIEEMEEAEKMKGKEVNAKMCEMNAMMKEMQAEIKHLKDKECQHSPDNAQPVQNNSGDSEEANEESESEQSDTGNKCNGCVQTNLTGCEIDAMITTTADLEKNNEAVEAEKLLLEEKLKTQLEKVNELQQKLSCSEELKNQAEELRGVNETLKRDIEEKETALSEIPLLEEKLEVISKEMADLQEKLKGSEETAVKVQDLSVANESLKSQLDVQEQLQQNSELVQKSEKEARESERELLQNRLKEVMNDNSEFKLRLESLKGKEEELKQLHDRNEQLILEIESLKENQQNAQSTFITDMVCELEAGSDETSNPDDEEMEIIFKKEVVNLSEMAPDLNSSETVIDSIKQSNSLSEDSGEIIFNQNAFKPIENTFQRNDSTPSIKLKDAELTIKALRNKLRSEEEDFFKREQALIHGYNAEINNLKSEIVKLKCKRLNDSQSKLVESHDLLKRLANETDSITSAKYSEVALLEELQYRQEQLFSLQSAFNQLQQQVKHSSGDESGEMDSSSKFKASPDIFIRDNLTNSVVQFEMAEYAVELDSLKTKVEEQCQTIKRQENLLLQSQRQAKELEDKLVNKTDVNSAIQNEVSEERSKVVHFEIQLQESKGKIEELQNLLDMKSNTQNDLKSELELLLKTKSEMEDTIEDLNVELSELKSENKEELEKALAMKDDERDLLLKTKSEMENMIEQLNMELNEEKQRKVELEKTLAAKGNTVDEVKSKLDFSLTSNSELRASIEDLNKKITNLEEKQKQKTEELEKILREKDELKSKLEFSSASDTEMNMTIEELRRKLMKLEEEISAKDILLEERCSDLDEVYNTNSSLKKDLTTSQSLVESLRRDLENAHTDLEKQVMTKDEELQDTVALLHKEKEKLFAAENNLDQLKKDHQLESAEVSQKLVLLEKEKRLTLRKLNEMKEREHEWQQKCDGQQRLVELENQLKAQLEETKVFVKNYTQKTSEPSEKLEALTTEVMVLKEERRQLNMELENLRSNSAKSEEECSLLRNQVEESQKKVEELLAAVNNLKAGLQDSDETTEQQEKFIKTQEEEILNLKSELDKLNQERNILERQMLDTEKNLTNSKGKHIAEMSLITAEVESLKKQCSHHEERVVELDQLKEKCSHLEDVAHEMEGLKERVEEFEKLKQECSDLKKDALEMETLKNEKNAEIKHLEEEVSDLKKEALEMKTFNNEKAVEIKRLKQECSNLKEAALAVKDKDVVMDQLKQECSDLKKSVQEVELLKQKAVEVEQLKQECSCLRDTISNKEQLFKEKSGELERLKTECSALKKSASQFSDNITAKKQVIEDLNLQLETQTKNMKDWKKEKDMEVGNFEEVLKKVIQEKKDLTQQVEKLKKDNSDLVKNVTNSRCAKDKVIEEYRKYNNTLSIELANAQGMTPPPKMTTPDNSYVEEADSICQRSVSSPAAAKKGRKRLANLKNTTAGTVEFDSSTPVSSSLKTIHESSELSPVTNSLSMSSTSVVSGLTDEIFSSLSPLPKPGKSQGRGSKRKVPPAVQNVTLESQNENELPARRSSRLRGKTSKN